MKEKGFCGIEYIFINIKCKPQQTCNKRESADEKIFWLIFIYQFISNERPVSCTVYICYREKKLLVIINRIYEVAPVLNLKC